MGSCTCCLLIKEKKNTCYVLKKRKEKRQKKRMEMKGEERKGIERKEKKRKEKKRKENKSKENKKKERKKVGLYRKKQGNKRKEKKKKKRKTCCASPAVHILNLPRPTSPVLVMNDDEKIQKGSLNSLKIGSCEVHR